MPEATETPETTGYTWTQHTFRCTQCGYLCFASQQYIDWARANTWVEEGTTDAEIATDIEFCLRCTEGRHIDGERAGPPLLRVRVHEADGRGNVTERFEECDLTECFSVDPTEALHVYDELQENGFTWVGGGAAQRFLITRVPHQQ